MLSEERHTHPWPIKVAGSPNLHNNTETFQLLNRREEYTVTNGLFVLEAFRVF